MNKSSFTTRVSTFAVIVVAIAIGLLQGKAFAQAGQQKETPPSVSAPLTSAPLANSSTAVSQEVQIVDAPGGNFGEGEDD